jgi:hypothetical protein
MNIASAIMFAACGLWLAGSAAGQEGKPLPAVKPATEGRVWGALVYASAKASDAKPAAPGPKGMEDLSGRLGKVFDYPHFEILGQHTQDVFREYESWVVPSRDLFLKVDSKGPAEGGGMKLNIQFWQDQQVLVKTDAVLKAESPLFIGGPKWRDGRLIFVLQLVSGGGGK